MNSSANATAQRGLVQLRGRSRRRTALAEQRRDDDTVIFYVARLPPGAAVPIGLLALEELVQPASTNSDRDFRSGARDLEASFPYDNLGVAAPPQLASAYRSATVGLCLSLTNSR